MNIPFDSPLLAARQFILDLAEVRGMSAQLLRIMRNPMSTYTRSHWQQWKFIPKLGIGENHR